MNITFLGTGTSQGIPIIGSDHPVCHSNDPRDKRLRTSALVQWDNYSVVIDCGPDFRQQMLYNSIHRLDAILFTHEHADHTAGLDDIRPFFFKQGDIPIYALDRVIENLTQRFGYILNSADKYPGAPSVQVHPVDPTTTFDIKNVNASNINIEERSPDELSIMRGISEDGTITELQIYANDTDALNIAFDITPGKYVTKFITELGIHNTDKDSIDELYNTLAH